MLHVQDRLFGLVAAILCALAAVVSAIFGAMQFVTISKNEAHSEVPGLILAFCVLVFVWTAPSLIGWLLVWRGRPGGYRFLSVLHLVLLLVAAVCFSFLLMIILTPIAIACESRYRRTRSPSPNPT